MNVSRTFPSNFFCLFVWISLTRRRRTTDGNSFIWKSKKYFYDNFPFLLVKKTSQFWHCWCCCCMKEFLILILVPSRTHRHKSTFLELPGINPGEWAKISWEFQLCQSAERRWEIQLMLSSVFFFDGAMAKKKRQSEREKEINERTREKKLKSF